MDKALQRFRASANQVVDTRDLNKGGERIVATAVSNTLAKRIANALNLYKTRRLRRPCTEHGSPFCSLCKRGRS